MKTAKKTHIVRREFRRSLRRRSKNVGAQSFILGLLSILLYCILKLFSFAMRVSKDAVRGPEKISSHRFFIFLFCAASRCSFVSISLGSSSLNIFMLRVFVCLCKCIRFRGRLINHQRTAARSPTTACTI